MCPGEICTAQGCRPQLEDASVQDVGTEPTTDASTPDGDISVDAGDDDASPQDSGAIDAGPPDTGPPDSRPPDTGPQIDASLSVDPVCDNYVGCGTFNATCDDALGDLRCLSWDSNFTSSAFLIIDIETGQTCRGRTVTNRPNITYTSPATPRQQGVATR